MNDGHCVQTIEQAFSNTNNITYTSKHNATLSLWVTDIYASSRKEFDYLLECNDGDNAKLPFSFLL